jgi:hypothetical protein
MATRVEQELRNTYVAVSPPTQPSTVTHFLNQLRSRRQPAQPAPEALDA